MDDKKISVEIFGEKYPLKTDDDPAYIQKLAGMVDKKMREVSQRTRTFAGNKIGVMAALELADECCQLQKAYDDMMELLAEK